MKKIVYIDYHKKISVLIFHVENIYAITMENLLGKVWSWWGGFSAFFCELFNQIFLFQLSKFSISNCQNFPF
jgi:hypothetical protein